MGSSVVVWSVDPLAGRYSETGLSGRLSQVSGLAGLARGGTSPQSPHRSGMPAVKNHHRTPGFFSMGEIARTTGRRKSAKESRRLTAAHSGGEAPRLQSRPSGRPHQRPPPAAEGKREEETKARGYTVTVPGDADMLPTPHRRFPPVPSPTSMARAREPDLRDENRVRGTRSTGRT